MKTRLELKRAAELLEKQGQEAWQKRQAQSMSEPAGVDDVRLNLFAFEERILAIAAGPKEREPKVYRKVRRIAVETGGQRPDYVLLEEHRVTNPEGRLLMPLNLRISAVSYEASDILILGHRLQDCDDFRERLDAAAARMAHSGERKKAQELRLAEIEYAAEGLELSVSSRMRMRANALALFEGEIDARDFVRRTVGRQRCYQTMAIRGPRMVEKLEVA